MSFSFVGRRGNQNRQRCFRSSRGDDQDSFLAVWSPTVFRIRRPGDMIRKSWPPSIPRDMCRYVLWRCLELVA
jgi:hypothetical protein